MWPIKVQQIYIFFDRTVYKLTNNAINSSDFHAAILNVYTTDMNQIVIENAEIIVIPS